MTITEDEYPKFRRAGGACICHDCGLPYERHESSEHLDFDDRPWLRVLCNGELVKL